eukprot:TRINITY_DN7981_c0_g1_i2.p1 TRINITY_DN7981_c0_g1~~TRINITY_DN7981_c0_g1_i2.p1  ORF type:complete len:164 (-),score=59.96 TRINITY_DN7981_c0_g1_i2:763-1254(-)
MEMWRVTNGETQSGLLSGHHHGGVMGGSGGSSAFMNRMRAVSVGDDDTVSICSNGKLSTANSDPDTLNSSFDSNSSVSGQNGVNGQNENNNNLPFCLKSYIVNLSANQHREPEAMMRRAPAGVGSGGGAVNKSSDMVMNGGGEAENMAISWRERMNDYSFMKR